MSCYLLSFLICCNCSVFSFFSLSSLELIIIINSILSPFLADFLQLLFRSSFQGYRIHHKPIAEYFHVIFYHFSNSMSLQFSSVQFSRSVVSDSLRPHESQHARPPCPSPSHGVHSNSCPSSQ